MVVRRYHRYDHFHDVPILRLRSVIAKLAVGENPLEKKKDDKCKPTWTLSYTYSLKRTPFAFPKYPLPWRLLPPPVLFAATSKFSNVRKTNPTRNAGQFMPYKANSTPTHSINHKLFLFTALCCKTSRGLKSNKAPNYLLTILSFSTL